MSDIAIVVPTAQIIIDARTRLNLSRKDLADLTGLTQAVIWRLEHVEAGAEKTADDELRNKISAALETFALAFPAGKPKAAKKAAKTPKTVVTGFTTEQVVSALSAVIVIAEDAKEAAKAKKSSTKGFDAILAELYDQSTRFVGQ